MERQRRTLSHNGPEVFRQSVDTLKEEKARSDGQKSEDVISDITSILARKGQKHTDKPTGGK